MSIHVISERSMGSKLFLTEGALYMGALVLHHVISQQTRHYKPPITNVALVFIIPCVMLHVISVPGLRGKFLITNFTLDVESFMFSHVVVIHSCVSKPFMTDFTLVPVIEKKTKFKKENKKNVVFFWYKIQKKMCVFFLFFCYSTKRKQNSIYSFFFFFWIFFFKIFF